MGGFGVCHIAKKREESKQKKNGNKIMIDKNKKEKNK
jgi:hypothetical protein